MVVTLNGVRSLRRYRLVIAQKSKLRLTQEVTAALASHSRDHRLMASGFFPCSIDREYLYGYAGDGYRSRLLLCKFTWERALWQALKGRVRLSRTSSDEERATTDGESEVEAEAEEADLPPEELWCPPIPDALDNPTEMEIAGAADKLATMMNSSQPQANVFFQPDNLGALPHL